MVQDSGYYEPHLNSYCGLGDSFDKGFEYGSTQWLNITCKKCLKHKPKSFNIEKEIGVSSTSNTKDVGLGDVSQQRELLIAFTKKMQSTYSYVQPLMIESYVDFYLKSNK